jgi:hypothetical protein
MSSIVIAGDTSGSVTLQAPATAGTTVLTLPSTSGTLAIGSGAMTFISVQTVSGTPSEIDFTSGISATYDDYVVIFENVGLSANTAKLLMLFYKSGAYISGTYRTTYIYASANGSDFTSNGETDFFIITRQSSSTNVNLRSGTINLFNLNSATGWSQSCTWAGQNNGSDTSGINNNFTTGGGTEGTAAAVTQLRFKPNSGTFTSGTFRLYGIQKS